MEDTVGGPPCESVAWMSFTTLRASKVRVGFSLICTWGRETRGSVELQFKSTQPGAVLHGDNIHEYGTEEEMILRLQC
jgi:hypothetical protein